MVITKEHRSPHFQDQSIPVEFVILHYTAQSLEGSLKIFLNSKSKAVSCHFLIDENGKIYELVSCESGYCQKAFHAGKSVFFDSTGKKWKNFNNFSVGIELVNWNGNIFSFPESQYKSLFELLTYLKKLYPSLQNPERILGHEHIAGFRGKKDPGYLFAWKQLFEQVYLDQKDCHQNHLEKWLKIRESLLTKRQYSSLGFLSNFKKWNDKIAMRLSLIMEKPLPFWIKKLGLWIAIRFG